VNALGDLIAFVEGLGAAGISYRLESVRNSIMVVIPCPDRYIEAEFFADGHVEVQFFGPPSSDVVEFKPDALLEAVIVHMNTRTGASPLDSAGT